MLAANKLKLFEELIVTFNREELFWLNGYITGKLSAGNPTPLEIPAAPQKRVNKVTITYGTETGNAKKLAGEFASRAKKHGVNAKLISLDQYRLNDLPKEEYLLSIISTQGDGEPPAAAKKFYHHIHSNGFTLGNLKYSVLALGDSSYPLFCRAGEEVDEQLERLGGERIVPLHRCDVDYETEADTWFEQVLQLVTGDAGDKSTVALQAKKTGGKKIYNGTILSNTNLNDKGSNKQTHHIEIAADELEYLPGDSLGVIPENPVMIVEQILQILNISHNDPFIFRNETFAATDLLKTKLNIIYLPERVVDKYARLVEQDIPATKIGLLDLLRIYPLPNNIKAEQLFEILEPITPRLYSISSSPEAHSGEIHLTVARDVFFVNEEQKCGICSDYLTSLSADSNLEFYIHKNNQFRLPADDRDIIMIGPGTGVAPFRSFLAQRDATGATGRNWLFFGDQHFITDFLYQTEIQNWKDTGALTNIHLAFSRDQNEKIYVQHKMLEQGQEFYNWLLSGASVYICGAQYPMSTDVENTLLLIIEKYGNKSREEATRFLDLLKDEGRYLKDVY